MLADAMIIGWPDWIARWLSKMRDQKSLTMLWRSFLEGHSDMVNNILVYNVGQYFHCGVMSLHSTWIIHDAWPTNVNTFLTLIARW